MKEFSDENGKAIEGLHPDAVEALLNHPWPGNVRELENLVQRLAALYSEETISQAIVERELGDNEQVANSNMSETSETSETPDPGLSHSVERHLSSYFAAHHNDLPVTGLYGRVLREVEKPLIALTLQATRGNQIKAAELLGVNRNTLRKKIRDLDIEVVRGLK